MSYGNPAGNFRGLAKRALSARETLGFAGGPVAQGPYPCPKPERVHSTLAPSLFRQAR